MAFRIVPAASKSYVDTGEELFGSDIDDEVWDEVLLQIESQRPLSNIASTDLEIEQELHDGHAPTSQIRSLRHALFPEDARAGIPDLEDIMEDIQSLRPMLPAQAFEHKSTAAFSIEGMSRLTQSDVIRETNRLTSANDSLSQKRRDINFILHRRAGSSAG